MPAAGGNSSGTSKNHCHKSDHLSALLTARSNDPCCYTCQRCELFFQVTQRL